METISQIVQFVSFGLNDQESGRQYFRWPQSVLIQYLNDALRQIAIQRPDEMTVTASLPLVPGSRQQLPDTYLYIFDITNSADDVCGTGKRMSRGDWDVFAAFNLPECTRPGSPVVSSDWYYNPNSPREYWVYPEVPQGSSGSVTASVRTAPLSFTASDLGVLLTGPGAKHLSAVYAWMRHQAYKLDTESMTSEKDSQDAYNEFRQSLGLSLQADARTLSGWSMGQRGNGDQNAARR